MKRFPLIALLLGAVLASYHCKHPKYSPMDLPGEQIRFGNGGGFTGMEMTYTLLENGQVFKFGSKAPQPMEVAAAKRRTARRLFETAESLGLLHTEFMHPGNTYQFIEFQDDGQQRRIAWGDGEHPVDPKIQSLFDELMQLVAEKK